jgi:hypothetical protein
LTGEQTVETWRKVWREGIAPQLSTNGVLALHAALRTDDDRLLQGATISPPLQFLRDSRAQGACVVGYCGWQGDGLNTVGEVEEFFAEVCFKVDKALGEPAACRWFLNWFDDTPRLEVRAELLREVRRTLAQRLGSEEHAAA